MRAGVPAVTAEVPDAKKAAAAAAQAVAKAAAVAGAPAQVVKAAPAQAATVLVKQAAAPAQAATLLAKAAAAQVAGAAEAQRSVNDAPVQVRLPGSARPAWPEGPRGPMGPMGPMGPLGATGPAGPQGIPGVSGYEIVSGLPTTCGPTGQCTGQAICPVGKRAVGGGYALEPIGSLVHTVTTGPTRSGASWDVGVYNGGLIAARDDPEGGLRQRRLSQRRLTQRRPTESHGNAAPPHAGAAFRMSAPDLTPQQLQGSSRRTISRGTPPLTATTGGRQVRLYDDPIAW